MTMAMMALCYRCLNFLGRCFGDAKKEKRKKKRPFVVEAKASSLILLNFILTFSLSIHIFTL